MGKRGQKKRSADRKAGSASRRRRSPKSQRRRSPAHAQPRTDQPSVFAVLQERYFPEGKGASRHNRVRAWSIYVVLTLLAVLGGYAGNYAYERWTTDSRLRAQQDAAREIDQEKVAFSSSIAYDTTSFESFKIVLDRPLTAKESENLQIIPPSELWDYFRPLGGRLIPYTSGEVPDTPLGGTWEKGTGTWGSAVFNMTLHSERSSALSIIDMTPVIISCEDPTAVTVINYPPQGAEYYSGVVVDLNHNAPVFYSTDEGPHKGKQFFQHTRIDLGGGAASGGLRVEANVKGQSCKWEIEAEYVDTQQNTGKVTLRDDGKPFFTEVAPSQPEQDWQAYASYPQPGMSFVPCHETPEDFACAPYGGQSLEDKEGSTE